MTYYVLCLKGFLSDDGNKLVRRSMIFLPVRHYAHFKESFMAKVITKPP